MKTCLIVDDSRVIRKISRSILEELGFRVDEVENGQEALEYCDDSMPEAILLDWNMPVMTGIEFMRDLRKTAGGEAPKVIFCTTQNDTAHVHEAISAGANEYLMKPFDQETLQVKMRLVGLL